MRIMTIDELRQYSSRFAGPSIDIDQVGKYLLVWVVSETHQDCRTDYLYQLVKDLNAVCLCQWERSKNASTREWVRILKVPIETFLFPPYPAGSSLEYDDYTLYVRIPERSRFISSNVSDDSWIRIFGGEILANPIDKNGSRVLKTKLEISIPNGFFALTTEPVEKVEEAENASHSSATSECNELTHSENGWREHLTILAKLIAGKFYRGVLSEMESALGYDEIPWNTPPEEIRIDSANDPIRV